MGELSNSKPRRVPWLVDGSCLVMCFVQGILFGEALKGNQRDTTHDVGTQKSNADAIHICIVKTHSLRSHGHRSGRTSFHGGLHSLLQGFPILAPKTSHQTSHVPPRVWWCEQKATIQGETWAACPFSKQALELVLKGQTKIKRTAATKFAICSAEASASLHALNQSFGGISFRHSISFL